MTNTNDKVAPIMTTIIIIGTYFGQWPVWFPAFLLSCARNETITWLFFTDCVIPEVTYANIRFEPMALAQLNDLTSKRLGFRIQKGAYSQADLQPAYGVIFEEYIRGFDFWGHCDIDVVWGNIRGFITEEILKNYDIVSCRRHFLAGHLTLWRNESDTNTLFQAIPAYPSIFSSSVYHNFDESIISTFLKTLMASGNRKIRVYWPEQMVVWFEGGVAPNGWVWDNGKIFDAKRREYIYLHFQASKRLITRIDFTIREQPTKFKLTQHGIQSLKPGMGELLGEEKWRNEGAELLRKFIPMPAGMFCLLKKLLLVKDLYWAQKLSTKAISGRDVRYDVVTQELSLLRLGLTLKKQQHFFLDHYYWALQLVEQRSAKFYRDDQDELYVDVGGVRVSLHCAQEIAALKKLFVDGIYNMQVLSPSVVLDINMNVGLPSLFFAKDPNVVVVGYEPCRKLYDQALHNITLNPMLAHKIQPLNVGVGGSQYRSIAGYFPQTTIGSRAFAQDRVSAMGPEFEYEEIAVEDVVDMVDAVMADYPGREIIVKIALERSAYFIDGISEYALINRLHTAGRLRLITAILLECSNPKPEQAVHEIVRQLTDDGFQVFLLSPYNPHEAILYAVQKNIGSA